MCFLGNLILSRPTSCEFYYDNVTVTSFINIKYGDVTVKFASRNEQRSDFGDCGPIGTGSVTAPAIQSRLGPSDYHLLTFGANGVNATWQKFASDTEMQSTARQWLRHQSTSFFFASGIEKLADRWDKCSNEFGRYVEKFVTIIVVGITESNIAMKSDSAGVCDSVAIADIVHVKLLLLLLFFTLGIYSRGRFKN